MSATTPSPDRVAEVFDAIVDLDPLEAERRLRVESEGNVALEAAVRGLLVHDRAAEDGFLEPVAERAFAVLSRAPEILAAMRKPARVLEDSSRLGRYHVLRRIGEGGMGSVYLGYDESLDRRVALKIVHHEALRDWLLREGRALGRLAHPNVVAVHEVGEHDGVDFLAMELVQGSTLRAWLDAERRSFTDVLRLFRQAGRGLAAVHAAGLVHRDFKPENVLVGTDGRAKITDFGIAALASRAAIPPEPHRPPEMSPEEAKGDLLTQGGAVLGTPAYMAPESLAGTRATPSSDQWSFAVALYRAAYETSPGTPVEPRPGVPAWLSPILARALAAGPSMRFRSMDDLLDAIDAHVPRDLDLDPTIVVDERRGLTVIFAGGFLVHSVAMIVPSSAALLVQPRGLVAVPALALLSFSLFLAARWRHLAKNRYGRRLAFMFPAFPAALLAHRLLCLRFGLVGGEILAADSFLFAVGYALLARDEHRWLVWLAAIGALQAAAAAAWIDRAPIFVGVGGLLTCLAIAARLFADRHMDPRAALAIQRDAEDGGEGSRRPRPA